MDTKWILEIALEAVGGQLIRDSLSKYEHNIALTAPEDAPDWVEALGGVWDGRDSGTFEVDSPWGPARWRFTVALVHTVEAVAS